MSTESPAGSEATSGTEEAAPLLTAERMVFFSDAVVAIAITLLALELPLPTGHGAAAVRHSLNEHLSDYMAFCISFLVIGANWMGHHRVFGFITGIGGRVLGLNMAWLFTVVLTPFATRTLTSEGSFGFGFGFYSLVQAASGLIFVCMVFEAQRNHLFREDTPRDLFRHVYRDRTIMAVVFAVAVPFGMLVHGWAFLLWICAPLSVRLVSAVVRGRRANHLPG